MSPSDHDRDQCSRHGGGESSRRGQKGQEKADRRRAMPMEMSESGSSILSPLYSHLPTLSSLRSYLPASPKKSPPPTAANDPSRWANWQQADLDDGKGKRPVLLISSSSAALEIWTVRASILPDDPHVQEEFPPPELVVHLPKIAVDDKGWEACVLAAKIMPRSTWHGQGPLVAAVLGIPASNGKRGKFVLTLALINLRSGKIVRSVNLGYSRSASLEISAHAIAIAISHPTPTVHLRDPLTLESLHSPLTDLPPSASSQLPTFSLSGRLLAYATSETPERPGPDSLGSLMTAKSLIPGSQLSGPSKAATPRQTDTSAALLNTAVNVGGAAARGIWAGVKMGVSAAGKAREARLARSAPTGGVLADDDADEGMEAPSESRSMEDSNLLDSLSRDSTASRTPGGIWVKVIDLHPRSEGKGRLLAHFRLPPSKPLLPLESVSTFQAPQTLHQIQTVSYLSFSPDGTQLVVVPADGKVLHIVELHPAGVRAVRGECKGEARHLYELRRGNTASAICDVAWDPAGRWIAVSTTHGTTDVFPIHPSGISSSSASHASALPFNPDSLPSLSTVIQPIARLRSPHVGQPGSDGPSTVIEDAATVAFGSFSAMPLVKGSFFQDVFISRAQGNILELGRIVTKARDAISYANGSGSGVSQMLRLGSNTSNWTAEDTVKARWSVPADEDGDELLLSGPKAAALCSLRSSLSQIEIQTHSIKPRILPASIYLSKQIDFFAAKAIDNYNPKSVMDREARTHRLIYRDEVEAKASSTLAASPFDEPLLSALHSVIESTPESQIPGLPNGRPPKWRSPIPIRHVKSGLHEGVGLLQREYAKAQRRRFSAAAANKLSFEEDTVFPSSGEAASEGLESQSSPSSEVLPTTEVGDDEEWGEGWEEEYRKAVEDDGGPDDLVLGLLDEEQEERRKWEARQKSLARQYRGLFTHS